MWNTIKNEHSGDSKRNTGDKENQREMKIVMNAVVERSCTRKERSLLKAQLNLKQNYSINNETEGRTLGTTKQSHLAQPVQDTDDNMENNPDTKKYINKQN